MNRRPDILCISSIDWDFIWQGHQEIMSRLAADGHRVLFIENTGVRRPSVRDISRVRKRAINWWKGTKGFRQERPNLFLHSPMVLPLPYSRIARWINKQIMLRSLSRWMKVTGFSRPIVWTFLPTPLVRDLIDNIDPALTIYYCIDDLASSSPEARRITASEDQLFREADLVLVTSEKLRQRAAQFTERVHLFPFGVSLEAFDRVRESGSGVPDDLKALPRPVAGYVGGLHQWVDQELLVATARQLPQVSFALVGPPQVDVSALEREPNIHLFGQRAHAELPRYVQGFDVGLVPYRITDYTANVYPTKLNEYLVMGVPVVATDLAEIRRFNQQHGELVQVAPDADAFAKAISSAIDVPRVEDRPRRVAVARSNGWDRRIQAMWTLIDEAVTRRDTGGKGWEERLRRMYTAARRRTVEGLVAVAVVYALVFYTPLLWWAASPLQKSDAPQPADAVVVFAGGVGESGKAGGGHLERLKQAVDLYKAGYAPSLILSSGYVFSFKEAEVMRALAIDQGVPADRILLEEQATNTRENVTFTNNILRERQWKRILLVSSPYHMRRATMVWHQAAPDVTVIPTPPFSSQFYEHGVGASLEQVRGIIWEYAALVSYWWRGWL